MKTDKILLKLINKTVLQMIKLGHLSDARLFAMFIKNKDKNAISILNKKFGRIFTDEELDEIAEVMLKVTDKFIPSSIRGSEAQEAEFMFGEDKNVISLFSRRRT